MLHTGLRVPEAHFDPHPMLIEPVDPVQPPVAATDHRPGNSRARPLEVRPPKTPDRTQHLCHNTIAKTTLTGSAKIAAASGPDRIPRLTTPATKSTAHAPAASTQTRFAGPTELRPFPTRSLPLDSCGLHQADAAIRSEPDTTARPLGPWASACRYLERNWPESEQDSRNSRTPRCRAIGGNAFAGSLRRRRRVRDCSGRALPGRDAAGRGGATRMRRRIWQTAMNRAELDGGATNFVWCPGPVGV